METSTSERAGSAGARPHELLSCGPFALHVPSRELRQGDARTRLQEQPFQILRLLLSRPGAVVTREELRRQLWPDGTFVDYEHSLNAAMKRLRAALGDDARDPKFIETLPRCGYRLSERLAKAARGRRIVILPFTPLAPRDDFGTGLADELSAQLGRRGGGRVQVVARMSAAACARAAQRACDIAESLAADYLLEGSVRRYGERARIAVWLVDAREEVQLWRGIYERRITASIPAQIAVASAIAQSIVDRLGPED